MALGLDPQVATELAPVLSVLGEAQPPPVGDVDTRRADAGRLFTSIAANWTPATGVEVSRHSLTTADGAALELRWYHPAAAEQPGSAALYLHGGGMIFGLEHLGAIYDLAVRDYVAGSGVPMLVVDYRIAPEHPHPTPVEDCYAALGWLAENAATLGTDPARLAVMGDSAGGGLAAGVCLLARDRGGPAVAQQLLIYPMLDDRTTTPDPPTPTSTSGISTSSVTRTSPTPAGCRMRACRPNCICTPDARMRSMHSRTARTSHNEQSPIASVACAPSKIRVSKRPPATLLW